MQARCDASVWYGFSNFTTKYQVYENFMFRRFWSLFNPYGGSTGYWKNVS
jgi:hypothetical protein